MEKIDISKIVMTCTSSTCPERTGGECTALKEMRVIFLDCDGVINCKTTTQRFGGCIGIDPYRCLLINRIMEKKGVVVVLSSTWRKAKKFSDEIKKFVDFIDITPGSEDGIRGGEIKQWLDEHPWVKQYAIVDDDSDMLPEQLPNFFHTTWENGLTNEIAKKIEDHFTDPK